MEVTQLLAPRFTAAFAQRLNRECPMTVTEAADHDMVEPGHVYIAPGSHHLQLVKAGADYRCVLDDGALVTGHRPSVDVLFRSVARHVGKSAIGVILTGMGKDGADGLLELRKAGGKTIGQDEASSLVYGMPHVAFERGAVMHQCALSQVADAILDACEGKLVEHPPQRMARAV
jgi:two-component system chemotaxis response regulator CheB